MLIPCINVARRTQPVVHRIFLSAVQPVDTHNEYKAVLEISLLLFPRLSDQLHVYDVYTCAAHDNSALTRS